jgi:hypothetical protein
VNIPKCPDANDPCEWIERERPTKETTEGKSKLAYGVNKDECEEDVRSVKEQKEGEGEARASYPDLTTTLRGTLADADGNLIRVNITVTSSVTSKIPYEFTYRIERGRESQGFLLVTKREEEAEGINVSWRSMESRALEREVKYQKAPIDMMKEMNTTLKVKGDLIEISRDLLEIRRKGKRIAATTAPAYRPKESQP